MKMCANARGRELLRANQADEMRNVLRIGNDAERGPAPELHGEEPLLNTDHADVLPGDSKQQRGCVCDSHWKGFTLTIKHEGTLAEDRLALQSGRTPMKGHEIISSKKKLKFIARRR